MLAGNFVATSLTSMPQAGFELTIPVFEWSRAISVLDRPTTVNNLNNFVSIKWTGEVNLSVTVRTICLR